MWQSWKILIPDRRWLPLPQNSKTKSLSIAAEILFPGNEKDLGHACRSWIFSECFDQFLYIFFCGHETGDEADCRMRTVNDTVGMEGKLLSQ